jgi:iron complex outermembrane recepter protein
MSSLINEPNSICLKPISFALAALLSALGTNGVRAQTADPAVAPATSKSVASEQLEKVIVTSQRRLEALQDVPISVKAFSSKQIENMGIKSTQDFINLTPNMSFDNSFTYGNSFVVIRGVTQINNADSPVAVVVDGVPQNNQKQLKMNLFDIQRIEVLKGPQGALYGRNAIGGAINIETKRPTNQYEGFGGFDIGNGSSREASGGISGAIVDDVVLFRIVGQAKKSDGLITNRFLGKNVDAVDHDDSLRAKVIAFPNSAVQLDFRAGIVKSLAGAVWDSIVASGNPNEIVEPRSNLLGKTKSSTKDFSFKADFDTGLGILSSITGYTDLTERYRGDIDFSNPKDLPGGFFGFGFQAGQGQNLNVKMLSQEIRITSPGDKPLRWIAGGYYLNTKRDLTTKAFIDTNGDLNQWEDTTKTLVNASETNNNKAYAGFGQIDFDFTRDLTFSSALRHDRDERNQTDVLKSLERAAVFSSWQPKFNLAQKFGPDALVYVTYSTGFRSGGFNAPGLGDFKSENLKNYELGVKSTLLGNRLILNAAIFYSQSKNFQYFYVNAATGSQVISNIDRVNLKGLDIDFRYLPIKGLEIDGGLGITQSRIKEYIIDPSTIGNRTPKSSPSKATLGVQYAHQVTSDAEAMVRFDIEHRSKKFWHPDNVAVSDSRDLLSLRVGLRAAKDKWLVNIYCRNLTNERYYADYNSKKYSGLPYDIGSLAPPREVGVEVKFKL